VRWACWWAPTAPTQGARIRAGPIITLTTGACTGGTAGKRAPARDSLAGKDQVWRSQLQLLEQSEGSDSSFYPTGTTSTVILA
jgi:hypothetical protein